ncbi:hypothetical protein ACN2C0_08580 [Aliarcobacter butzleri]|uniref:hypothetical protein n=1 Tax=Aliarcobacter butzleri TaxID=28197 RepID=UPI003AFA3441
MENKNLKMHYELKPITRLINEYCCGYIKKLNKEQIIKGIYDILNKYKCADYELMNYCSQLLHKRINNEQLLRLFTLIDDNYQAIVSDEEYRNIGLLHHLK